MKSGTLRNFLGAALASAACAFGAPAHATHYSVGFDPIMFSGVITIDVDSSCLAPFPGTNTCAFDVLGVNFVDSTGMHWFDPSVPETGIGQKITVDGSDNITAIQVTIGNLEPVEDVDNPCDGQHLSFALTGVVTFTCGGDDTHNGTGTVTFIRQIPEPATYALLGLGLLGLAATRRRQRA